MLFSRRIRGLKKIHDFLDKKEIPDKAIDKINLVCSENKFEILNIVKCGQYSPGKYRICIDFRII